MISYRNADIFDRIKPTKEIEFYFSSWAGSESKFNSEYIPHPETFSDRDYSIVRFMKKKLGEIPDSERLDDGKLIIHIGIEDIGSAVENIAKEIPGFHKAITIKDTRFEYRVKVWFK